MVEWNRWLKKPFIIRVFGGSPTVIFESLTVEPWPSSVLDEGEGHIQYSSEEVAMSAMSI